MSSLIFIESIRFVIHEAKGPFYTKTCNESVRTAKSWWCPGLWLLPRRCHQTPTGDTLAPKRQICTFTKYIAGQINFFQNWKHSRWVYESRKKKIWSFNANTFVKIRMYWIMVLLLTKFIVTSHLAHCCAKFFLSCWWNIAQVGDPV